MSKNITISFTISLSDEAWGGPSIIFHQWIPENDSDVIVVNDNSKEVRIYIDKSCVSKLGEVTDELISSWVNISVSKLKIEVILEDISDDLANFIYDERDSPKEIHHGLKPEDNGFESLQERYKDMGIEIAKLSISAVNRIISYARNIKGQYWLTEQKFDENRLNSLNVSFRAKSKIDDGKWFRWCPPNTDRITIYLQSDESSIKKDDWGSISTYVQSKNRPNLILSFLPMQDIYLITIICEAVL
jgi:hypothetical protein